MSFEARFVGICKCGCNQPFDRGTLLVRNREGNIVIEGHEEKKEDK
jgi:hypothetical protein